MLRRLFTFLALAFFKILRRFLYRGPGRLVKRRSRALHPGSLRLDALWHNKQPISSSGVVLAAFLQLSALWLL